MTEAFSHCGKELLCDDQHIGDMVDEWTAKRVSTLLNERPQLVQTIHNLKIDLAILEKKLWKQDQS